MVTPFAGGAEAMGSLSVLAGWLLTYLVHSSLLLGGAWIASRLVTSLSLRDAFWKAAVAGPLLTATVSLMLPERAGAIAPSSVALFEAARAVGTAGGAPFPVDTIAALVVVGWALTAVFGLSRLEHGRRRYWKQVGRRETLADGETVCALRRLQNAAGCRRTIYLTTADGLSAPAAIGAAEICLPAESLAALGPAQRESVLAHELGHLIRRDPLWRFGIDLLAALFLIQPLLRIARREVMECAEMLCDDFAVRLTGLRRPLVESLALLAAALRPDAALAAAFGEGESPLVRRAARVLDPDRAPSRPLRPAAAALITGALLLCTLAFAPVVALPTPAKPAGPLIFTRVAEEHLLPGDLPPGLLPGDPPAGARLVVRSRVRDEQVTVQRTPDGELTHEYSREGVVVEPDAAARRWIADVIAQHGLR